MGYYRIRLYDTWGQTNSSPWSYQMWRGIGNVQLPEVPGHMVTLINAIKPAAEEAHKHGGDLVEML